MYCLRKVTDDLIWVGANDRRLAMFEGIYSVPDGVSYNSYLLLDEKTVLFDTVDKAVGHRFMENLEEALGGRRLDYLIVQHMEPDHSFAIKELADKYPDMTIVGNPKTLAFIKQFYDFDIDPRFYTVEENDILATGKHELCFIMAPMVHWPEVMVTYDAPSRTLFSADMFGSFGALNGALFADEVDFNRDFMDEARRYYANIIGKYGPQVQAIAGKTFGLKIDMVCPLHGFVWRRGLGDFFSKYLLWGTYEPEEKGVMIAYASIYGNTENAAEILATKLRGAGVRTAMYDVSVTHLSDVLAAAFKWSHLVFASATYNAGIFIAMDELINDLVAHNISNRTVAIIENGSWAPASGGLIREKLEGCADMKILDNMVSIKSSVKEEQLEGLSQMADAIIASIPGFAEGAAKAPGPAETTGVNPATMFKLSYGLFVLTAQDGDEDNGCIINTAAQVTETPMCVSVTVNKANHTHDMIMKSGDFNVSILTESVPFSIFERFGFHSGKDTDKFEGYESWARTESGVGYLTEHTGGVISAKVKEALDFGTHTVFVGEVNQAFLLSGEPSVTYQYYFDHIKPKPQPKGQKRGFRCIICGFEYEGETLPDDYICPICKHGVADFEKM